MSSYAVFAARGQAATLGRFGDEWAYVGSFEAGSRDQAVRQAAAKNGAGFYAAVPVRFFKPREVKARTRHIVSDPMYRSPPLQTKGRQP